MSAKGGGAAARKGQLGGAVPGQCAWGTSRGIEGTLAQLRKRDLARDVHRFHFGLRQALLRIRHHLEPRKGREVHQSARLPLSL